MSSSFAGKNSKMYTIAYTLLKSNAKAREERLKKNERVGHAMNRESTRTCGTHRHQGAGVSE
jgi:hypothetical protein